MPKFAWLLLQQKYESLCKQIIQKQLNSYQQTNHCYHKSISANDHTNKFEIDYKKFLLYSKFKSDIIKINLTDRFAIMTCRRSEKFFWNAEYTIQIIYKILTEEKLTIRI